MSALNDVITDALYVPNVRDRIAAALLAGDDAEAGRIIREAVGVAIAEHAELERERRELDIADAEEALTREWGGL